MMYPSLTVVSLLILSLLTLMLTLSLLLQLQNWSPLMARDGVFECSADEFPATKPKVTSPGKGHCECDEKESISETGGT